MSVDAFSSLIAIAQSTPGPIALNAATLVGWQKAGFFGALAATFSVIAFPLLAMSLTLAFSRYIPIKKDLADESLRSGSMAMIIMTLWTLLPQNTIPMPWMFALASFALLHSLKSMVSGSFLDQERSICSWACFHES